MAPMTQVQVNVNCPTKWGDRIIVTGCHSKLGAWRPEASMLELNTKDGCYPRWSGSIALPGGESVRFKFVILSKNGELRWEDSIDDREIIVPRTGQVELQADFDETGLLLLSDDHQPPSPPKLRKAPRDALRCNYPELPSPPTAVLALLPPTQRRAREFEESTWPSLEVLQRAAAECDAEDAAALAEEKLWPLMAEPVGEALAMTTLSTEAGSDDDDLFPAATAEAAAIALRALSLKDADFVSGRDIEDDRASDADSLVVSADDACEVDIDKELLVECGGSGPLGWESDSDAVSTECSWSPSGKLVSLASSVSSDASSRSSLEGVWPRHNVGFFVNKHEAIEY